MKKTIILFALLLMMQTNFATDFHFGFRASPTVGWFGQVTGPSDAPLSSNGIKLGFAYGLMLDFGFTSNYSLTSGLDIAYRTGKLKYTYSDFEYSSVYSKSYSMEYIEIPLTLKLKTNEIGYIRYFGQFGGSLNINIRAHADYDSSVTTLVQTYQGTSTNNNVYSEINPISMSMVIGGGIEYSLQGHTQLMVGLTYNNGFIDVLKDKDINTSKGTKTLNYSAITNYIALNVGIYF